MIEPQRRDLQLRSRGRLKASRTVLVILQQRHGSATMEGVTGIFGSSSGSPAEVTAKIANLQPGAFFLGVD
ncbi:Protein of unknown function [Pyronema omphalodes CBS 100304]|uniref:Uncharacterized protein n=1 Tax=Pyronema omphalodes (strain CBS 100304) TaxID=1076935 RepID=U4LN40_PYROM|nr:Protein of unknown function [Pyronema omphalodes CBS 100304]